MLVINIFVLPIAVSGLLHFPAGMLHADFFVLAIPMEERAEELALLAFIGGLSAATGMVIVATIALSTMICNDLIMPAMLRLSWLRLTERGYLSALLIGIRRGAIVLILLLSFAYFTSEEHTSELQSLMRISYAVFCLTSKITKQKT